MKKQLSMLLATAMLSAPVAFAEEALSYEESAVSLIYNAEQLSADGVEPVIVESRTMLPFRALLENIGATVGYDEATRTVTAQKDETVITFGLDSVEVSVQKGEAAAETVTPDVANVIINDRVYVPVRFMAESFGMQVGWDAELKTAIIVDLSQYCKELIENSENFSKYAELCKVPENYTSDSDLTFVLEFGDETENYQLNLAVETTTDLQGSVAANNTVLNLDTDLFEKLGDLSISELKDVQFRFAYKEGNFYFKTNLVEKLKEIAPDHEFLNSISTLVSENTWYKANLEELFAELGLPAEWIEIIKDSMRGNNVANVEAQLEQMLASGTFQQGINTVADAESIDLLFEVYKTLFSDENIKLNQIDENTYELVFILNKDILIDLIAKLSGEEVTEEMKAEVEEMLTFDCTVKSTLVNGVEASSEALVQLGFLEEGTKLNLKLELKSALTADPQKTIEIPEVSMDLINLLKMLEQ